MKILHGATIRSAIILCGLGMAFSPSVKGAEATPKPSPAVTTNAAVPVATPPELHPAVKAVGIHTQAGEVRKANVIQAQRGDQIWVDVHNFKIWVDSLGDKAPKNRDIKDLILYLDHFPLLGVSPIYWHETKH